MKQCNTNSIQEIIKMKAALFDSLSEISQTYLIPQRTDNIHISCGNFAFNQPDSPFNSADEKVIVSSIIGSFNRLFGVKLSIPTLKKLEEDIQVNFNLETERAQREQSEKTKRDQKAQEESQVKERLKMIFLGKKEFYSLQLIS
jgi:hypothetical protein